MRVCFIIIGLSIGLAFCLFNEMYAVGFCMGFILSVLIARWWVYHEDKYI